MEQNYDDKIKEVKNSLNKLESKKNKTNSLTRKERAAHLIQKGALLEIAGIDNVDSEILLGYFLWFKDVPEEKLEKLKVRGRKEFERRKKQKFYKISVILKKIENLQGEEKYVKSSNFNIFRH